MKRIRREESFSGIPRGSQEDAAESMADTELTDTRRAGELDSPRAAPEVRADVER
jgi:hypothetical protein